MNVNWFILALSCPYKYFRKMFKNSLHSFLFVFYLTLKKILAFLNIWVPNFHKADNFHISHSLYLFLCQKYRKYRIFIEVGYYQPLRDFWGSGTMLNMKLKNMAWNVGFGHINIKKTMVWCIIPTPPPYMVSIRLQKTQ